MFVNMSHGFEYKWLVPCLVHLGSCKAHCTGYYVLSHKCLVPAWFSLVPARLDPVISRKRFAKTCVRMDVLKHTLGRNQVRYSTEQWGT